MARTKITAKLPRRLTGGGGIKPVAKLNVNVHKVNVHYSYSDTLSLTFPPWSLKDSIMMEVDATLTSAIIKPYNYIDLTNDDTVTDDTSTTIREDEEHEQQQTVLTAKMEARKKKRRRSGTIGYLN